MSERQPLPPRFHIAAVAIGDNALALALLSWFPFTLEGDSMPPFSVCPPVQSSSPDLTARV